MGDGTSVPHDNLSVHQNTLRDRFAQLHAETAHVQLPFRTARRITNPFVKEAVDTTYFADYKKFWDQTGRKPENLQFLLDNLAFVPPNDSRETIIDTVGELKKIAAQDNGKVFVVSDAADSKSGGLFQRSTELETLLKSTQGKIYYKPEATGAYEKLDVSGTFYSDTPVRIVFCDDASYSGDKAERYTYNFASRLVPLELATPANIQYHFLLGGITSHAAARLQRTYTNSHIHALYRIPALFEMMEPEDFASLRADLDGDFKYDNMETCPSRLQPFQTLTMHWYGIPDSFSFPEGLTKSRPMRDSDGNEHYLFDDKRIAESSSALIHSTPFHL